VSLSKRDRFRVLVRDQFTCRYCGRSAPNVVLEVDHRKPRCQGGSDDQWNLVTACHDCNRSKGGTPLPPRMYGDEDVTARSQRTATWWVISIITDLATIGPEDEGVQFLLWKAGRANPVLLSTAVDKVREWARAERPTGTALCKRFASIIFELEESYRAEFGDEGSA
jgi:hypothetical protein